MHFTGPTSGGDSRMSTPVAPLYSSFSYLSYK